MARHRKPIQAKDIPMQQPDRSTPTNQTLLNLAEERNLFQQADDRKRALAGAEPNGANETKLRAAASDEALLSPGADRVLEAMLYTTTLAMIHFTFDVLVQHQYGTELSWSAVCKRTATAWAVFLVLFYPLHAHRANPTLIPGLPLRYQNPIRQAIFFAMSVSSGCYMIYVTNSHGYLATMKRAPPLACLWLWAVLELDLAWATLSLVIAATFLWWGGYDIK